MNKKTLTKDVELKKLAQLSERELLMHLRTSKGGLSEADAKKRLAEYGLNQVNAKKPRSIWQIIFDALKDPFVLVLALLMIVSGITGDLEAVVVMGGMILASITITFIQEYRSEKASFALKEMIENTATVVRNGKSREIPMDEVVPGDLITLATGDMIPADALLLWTKDLFVNQSSLTGESLPVEKGVGQTGATKELSAVDFPDLVFMGTDVLSGQGQAIILKTGQNTFFGDIAHNATQKRGDTAFDIGLKKVSKLLLSMVFILFPVVFLLNGVTKGDWGSAFFFAIAVAVGLTPEMLPMIVTSNLAKGAMNLSRHKVIVKELPAIQNLGAMDILCTDKTGTITEDKVVLVEHLNPLGEVDHQVLDMAFLNAYYQTGWKNVMDVAVIEYYQEQKRQLPYEQILKIDELPFDFSRRRLSVVVKAEDHQLMITKGAVEEMADVCQYVEIAGQVQPLTAKLRQKMSQLNRQLNEAGMRVLAVAVKKDAHKDATYTVEDEKELTLIGYMGFLDPAKASAASALAALKEHGVSVKVLTGDNALVAKKVCKDVGIEVGEVLLGSQIETLSDLELAEKVEATNLYAKLNPMQKARLIGIMQTKGHTVGFMGDGINDAPALRKADVGISVDTAADITKDASSIILLEKSLQVLETGVLEGRKVFYNMMKYIKITLSSNFGNVFSILVASAFLPFLPMISLQLLVQNLIYDFAQLTIPWDHVDSEELQQPANWQIKDIFRFTLAIGPVSSLFDIFTYLVMWFVFGANNLQSAGLFQTGWFLVGLTTQTLVVHVIRTRKLSFVKSHAAWPVLLASLSALVVGFFLVLTPLRQVFDFVSLPKLYFLWFGMIVIGYLITMEAVKRFYISRTGSWL
ncbi:magnesium-translocating P-type ATPase [Enterococcus sp. 2201sp1_2201st1_C11_2201SCRN_220225]|uniref:magnesium-translocating P-type ATPase n=3 Tax=unclassified Enterococcus TaxID=2608891 RepID=UPI0034A1E26B